MNGGYGTKKKRKCYICSKPCHRMLDCFYNPKSLNYKPQLLPDAEASENLRKRGIVRG